MTTHKTTSDRMIRVEGCHNCPWKYEHWERNNTQWRYYVGHICYIEKFDINECVDNETIHKDCPLEKAEKEKG